MSEASNVQADETHPAEAAIKDAKAVTEARNTNNTTTKETEIEYVTCPCCGKPTLVRPIKIKGTVLDHYLTCIMSGVPFWHT